MSVIERPQASAGAIAWSQKEATLRVGDVLRVREGEAAVITRWGSLMGVLGPGEHALDPARVPFLYNVLDPGAAEGTADVSFVSTVEHGWHEMSAEPRRIADAASGLEVDVRFTGSFSMQVTDPAALVREMPDPSHEAIYRWVESTVDRACRDVASAMASEGVRVLDLRSEQHARALAERTLEAVAPKLEGTPVRVVRFGSLLVHIDEADAQRLAAPRLVVGGRALVRWTDGREHGATIRRVDGAEVEVAWDAGGLGRVPASSVRPA